MSILSRDDDRAYAEYHQQRQKRWEDAAPTLPDIGGIDATAAAMKRLGDLRTRFAGLNLQNVRAFELYDEYVAEANECGVEARFKMEPVMDAGYHAWAERGAREERVEVTHVAPAPIPPVTE